MKILDAFLQKALTVCSCYYLAAYCVLGALRMPFPGAMEWLESNMYYQMLRVLEGQALYVAPSLEYVPSIYPPLYFYIAALLAQIFGPDFWILRLISYVSSLGSMALIGHIVYRESNRRIAGLWAAGLFAATYHISATYFDTGRIDPLFLFLSLGTLAMVRFVPGMTGCLFAAGLLAAAMLTKQTALILSFPLVAYIFLFRSRFQALCFGGFFLVLVALPSLWLNAATQGWYFFFAFELPAQHPILWNRLGSFWLQQILAPMGIAACLSVSYFFLIPLKKLRAPALLYALFFITMLAVSCMPWIKSSGFKNVLPPAHAALAIGTGLALAAARANRIRLLLLAAACVQFALLWYSPLPLVPAAGNAKVVHSTIAAIKEIDGEVFAPANGYLSVVAGKTHSAHIGCINDVLDGEPGPVRDGLISEIRKAIRDKRFAAILLDRKFNFFQRDIETHYILWPHYAENMLYRPLIKYWYIPKPRLL
jgi:Dolichyl-phosphate-mannose-protein mannosyltransferase